MALITCPECKRKRVSTQALACPKCGYAISEYYERFIKEENLNINDTKTEKHNTGSQEISKLVNSSKKKNKLLISFLVVLILLLVISFIYIKNNMSSDSHKTEEMNDEDIVTQLINDDELLYAYAYYEAHILNSGSDNQELEADLKSKIAQKGKLLFDNGQFDSAYDYFLISAKSANETYYSERHACHGIAIMQKTDYLGMKVIDSCIYIDGQKYDIGYNAENNVFETIDGEFYFEIPKSEMDSVGYITKESFSNNNEIINWPNRWYVEIKPSNSNKLEKKDPRIGMTKEEVEQSTWGKPNKINKDEYRWGIYEQWCYSNGYIYIENGLVTSIQYR